MTYPKHLHDLHNEYPLAAEHLELLEAMLSPFNQKLLEKNKKDFKSTTKLCPNFFDKTEYVLSLENLQFYLKMGLVLTKTHSVISFKQDNFMEQFIVQNSESRRNATSQFSKDHFKLLNNSQYGKFVENIQNRSSVEFCSTEKRARYFTNRPQYKAVRLIDGDKIAIVHSAKTSIKFDNPIGAGFICLERSKHIMMQFWYGVLKPRYLDRIQLILSDTDSFIFKVYTENAYKDLLLFRESMDMSVYNCSSPFYVKDNKKVPGCFSDEKPDAVITEVIALKPKLYSIQTQDHFWTPTTNNLIETYKTSKGIKASAVTVSNEEGPSKVKHSHYKTCLEDGKNIMVNQRLIRSYNDELRSISQVKIGLGLLDDKKWINNDGITTTAHGHHSLYGPTKPCLNRRCACCVLVLNKEQLLINNQLITVATGTCLTRNSVYMIVCKCCGLPYIGASTSPLNKRMTVYYEKFLLLLKDTDNQINYEDEEFSLGLHLLALGFKKKTDFKKYLSIVILEVSDPAVLKARVCEFMYMLNALKPYGINRKNPLSSNIC